MTQNVRLPSAALYVMGILLWSSAEGPRVGPASRDAPCAGGALVSAELPYTPHAYFETLTARPDCLVAYDLRTAAKVARYKFGVYSVKVTYDPEVDAAKWTWGNNDLNAEQLRLPIILSRPASGSSKILIISDHYWDDKWFTEWIEKLDPATGAVTRLDGFKWLQVTDKPPERRRSGVIWFEPQMRWMGWDAGVLAWFGARGYQPVRSPTVKGGEGVRVCGKNFLGDSIGPMLSCFQAKPFTWTRAFIEVEQRAGDDHARISYWMADETQEPMPILRNAEMLSGGINDEFWIEYNTSRETRVGGPMAAYARNVIVLRNVADPHSVFARPDKP